MDTDNLGFFSVRQTSVIYYEAWCKEKGKWEGGGEGVRGGWSARIIIEMMWYFLSPYHNKNKIALGKIKL